MRRHAGAPAPPETEGPLCARCEEDHASSTCPHFQQRRGRRASEMLQVGPLDSAYVRVLRDLHRVASVSAADAALGERCDPWPRYFIVNTSKSGAGGVHWFTLAYSIRRRE